MEKKRSVGVIVFAIIVIILGAFNIWRNLNLFVWPRGHAELDYYKVFSLILGVTLLISGLFMLILKSWARKLCIVLSMILLLKGVWITKNVFYYVFFSVDGPGRYNILSKVTWEAIFVFGGLSIVIGILLPISIIYFFTRPKVKEQFK